MAVFLVRVRLGFDARWFGLPSDARGFMSKRVAASGPKGLLKAQCGLVKPTRKSPREEQGRIGLVSREVKEGMRFTDGDAYKSGYRSCRRCHSPHHSEFSPHPPPWLPVPRERSARCSTVAARRSRERSCFSASAPSALRSRSGQGAPSHTDVPPSSGQEVSVPLEWSQLRPQCHPLSCM